MTLRYAPAVWTAALFFVVATLAPPAAAQDLLHYWNFNDPVENGNPWPAPIAATQGSGEITYSFDTESLNSFGGTTNNAQGGDSAGSSFVPTGQSENGEHFDLAVSTEGFEAIEMVYATRGTGTGFDTQTISYSIDGGTSFSELTTFTERNNTGSSFEILAADLSDIEAANDNPDLVIRITVDGASSGPGNNRFDNITIEGFPLGDAPDDGDNGDNGDDGGGDNDNGDGENGDDEGYQPPGDVDTINEAREQGEGATVTIQGVVTRAFGDFVRLQDGTGSTGASGMTVRQNDGALADAFQNDIADGTIAPGTILRVEGTLSAFNELLQINDADLESYSVEGTTEVPSPQNVTLSTLDSDGVNYESVLVRVDGVTIDETGRFQEASNYTARDGTGSLTLRVQRPGETDVINLLIPSEPFDFEGVIGQFNGDIQLIPMLASDFITDENLDDPGDANVMPVADARAESDGTQVTVEGIVTRARGRYVRFQDDSGGLTIFDGGANFSGTVSPGDSIRVTSTLNSFNDARQLDTPVDDLLILSSGNPLPDPQEITLEELNANLADNDGLLESQLVRVEGVTINTNDIVFQSSTTYDIEDATDTGSLRLQQDRDTALDGEPVPQDAITFQGIVGRFQDNLQLEAVRVSDVLGDSEPIDLADALICEIQGTSFTTPVDGEEVTTRNNVVTVLADNGFFMQMTEREEECAEQASRGLFVFTSGSPSVSPGDLVDITATAVDFNGSTQLTDNPNINVVGSAPIPEPVTFNATTPDPSPRIVPDLYRYQSMLVRVENAISTSGSDRFGNFYVDAGGEVDVERNFRQPGLPFPGQPGLPVWGGSQQLFEIATRPGDFPSNFDIEVPRGTTILEAEGPLTFAFGEHVLWPTALTIEDFDIEDTVAGVRPPEGDEFGIGALNLLDLFGPSGGGSTPGGYNDRLAKHAVYICDLMQAPTILGVQEVGGQETLEELADEIEDECGVSYDAYTPAETPSSFTTGALVHTSVQNVTTEGLGAGETFGNNSRVHDRLPFLVNGDITTDEGLFPVSMLVLHNRSRIGLDSGDQFVRDKRLAQSESIAQMVQDLQDANPGIALSVVGDFNAFEFTDGIVDVVGEISGTVTPGDQELEGNVAVSPPLVNQVTELPPEERYSFIFEGSAQVLDHILTSEALTAGVTGRQYVRANSDAPSSNTFLSDPNTTLRSSDHDGMVVYVSPTATEITSVSIDVNRTFDDPTSSASYRLVGLPGQVSVDLADTVTGEQGPDWRAFRETGTTNSADAFLDAYDGSAAFTFRPGRGFWMLAQNGWSFTGDVVTLESAVAGDPSIELQDGWNIISNPLLADLDWDAVQTANNIDVPLWQWNGAWQEASTFASASVDGEAYYVLNEDDLGTLTLPVDEAASGTAVRAAATEQGSDEAEARSIALTGTVAGEPFSGFTLTFDANATGTRSHLAPPAHFEQGALRVEEGDARYASRVVPADTDQHQLTLTLRGTPGATASIDLTARHGWETSADLPGVRLTHADTGREYALNTGPATVDIGDTGTVTLRAEIGALDAVSEVVPEQLALRQNYPNPFQGQTTLEYAVPESMDIEVSVYNVLGQRVTTIERGTKTAGTHQVVWDGKADGRTLASGVYFVRITGNGDSDVRRVTIVR